MEFRATEEQIYAQVKKDTKEVFERTSLSPKTVRAACDLRAITDSIRETLKAMPFDMARSVEEMHEAIELAETKEDWLLIAKHWIGRLASGGKCLGEHYYNAPNKTFMRLSSEDGGLYLYMHSHNVQGHLLQMSGKPSRVLGKIFGEKFVTYMCQHHPIKGDEVELHFATHYIPELYRMMARDENLDSCMSKHSSGYGLPDTHHPTLAYEDSPNAALALLYDKKKKRHVARAIVGIHLPGAEQEVQYSTSYGCGGRDSRFEELGLCQDGGMWGLKLSIKYFEGERLVPYVDGNTQRLTDDGCYLIVDEGGDLEGSYETGREMVETFYCDCCGNDREGEPTYTYEGHTVCESCLEDDYREVGGEYHHIENLAYLEDDGEYVHIDDAVWCEWSDRWYRNDVTTHQVRNVGSWCDYTVVEENLAHCMESWNIETIDDTPLHEWLGEEEAA